MNIDKLVPSPSRHEAFRRNRGNFVPEVSGCYVLTSFSREIMYVGLAKNLRRRFIQHLDSPDKVSVNKLGRALLFWWYTSTDINKVERTWMNIHLLEEGALPVLNKVYSPVGT